MSTQVRVSDHTYKSLKDYCEKGEKPQMLAVIDLAVAEYLERKNEKDDPGEMALERAIELGLLEQAAPMEGG